MDIDIERLATDFDYWNAVAPEGAECRVNDCFAKWTNSAEHTWDEAGARGWFAATYPWPLSRYVERDGFNVTMKPRPTAWNGEGLPPVGVMCESRCMARGNEKYWFKTTVRYLSEYTAVVDNEGDGEIVAHPNTMRFRPLRPLRTPEQIQRDELACLIGETVSMRKTFGEMADALIAAGYHK